MKTQTPLLRQIFYFITIMSCVTLSAYQDIPLRDGWKFHLGDIADGAGNHLDDSSWERIRLPHDWSIHQQTDADHPSDGGGGFFPTGKAWYRRAIEMDPSWEGQRIFVHFEGIYRNGEIWINGKQVASRANGYLPVRAELTPHLVPGKDNVLAVRVDNSLQPNSRWYSGSGIYRPARLEIRHPVHLVHDGVRVHTSALYPETATIEVQAEVDNTTRETVPVEVNFVIASPEGLPLASESLEMDLEAGKTGTCLRQLPISYPKTWSPDSPTLYRVITRTTVRGLLTDRQDVSFGIRTIEVDARNGLRISDVPVKMLGGNVHHDNGPLGAAAFADAEERRVRILKESGFNAIRTSHNPPSEAFLDACDRLGMLVVAEAFDCWKAPKLEADYSIDFDDNWEQDLKDFITRDRNHPSIILWSIGNEMFERGKAHAVDMAEAMVGVVRQNDTTRPITVGLNGLGESGDWKDLDPLFSKLDVVGYNYELPEHHLADHERLPNRVMFASESFANAVFDNWAITTRNDYVIGDFTWTAMDYLGEAGIGRIFPPDGKARAHWEGSHYPWHGAACGDIDLTGWRKPVSHYRNIVWDRGETLYIAVKAPYPTGGDWITSKWSPPPFRESWTWPGHEDQLLTVDVYSQHETIRLFLDRTLIGEASVSEETGFKASFKVPYRPGTLIARAMQEDTVVEEVTLSTAGEPRQIQLITDRDAILPDGQHLAFIEVIVTDAGNRRCPDADPSIEFSIEGPGEILSIGSGDLTSTEPYGANPRKAYQGRALVIIRSLPEPGDILLRAQSDGLIEGAVSIRSYYPY